VAAALDAEPRIEAKIREIIWMGGALEVKGNVVEPDHDGSAEWNVYWDPPAAARVWRSRIPIVLCPLDVTNTVPVTLEFLRRLSRLRRHPLCDLAAQSLAAVYSPELYFWDVLTAAYVGRPDLFTVRERETAIVTAGASQGRTKLQPGGRQVRVLHKVSPEAFQDYVVGQWSR
jgi:purine nucleosidase